MGEAIEEGCRHLGIAEDGGPFAEAQVGGDDDAGALVEMAWLPPSPDGIVMCQDVGLRTTKRRGRRDETYNNRGGSGKECFPASRGRR